jgi:glycosyltransferase involved in cell wall biosynthesis
MTNLVSRREDGVPDTQVKDFAGLGLRYWYSLRRARSEEQRLTAYIWAGRSMCTKATRHIRPGCGVYTYNSCGLELLKGIGSRGGLRFHEQTIAPKAIELALLADESGMNGLLSGPLQRYIDREEEEWKHADAILCGSEFVKEGIRRRGGPVERCHVVPYGVHLERAVSRKMLHGGPLRVLFAGTVGVRKGFSYLVDGARMAGSGVELLVAGELETPGLLRNVPSNIRFLGRVPRTEMADLFSWADVLALPSLCEGSATVSYEALVRGIPVIATMNAGTPVRDGVDGFIVPHRDADAIGGKLAQLIADRSLLARLQEGAREGAAEHTLEGYGRRLIRVIREVASGGPEQPGLSKPPTQ